VYSCRDRTGGFAPPEGRPVNGDYLTMGEAQQELGVSMMTIWRMVKDGRLPSFRTPLDRRKKLVRRADVEKLKQPQPVTQPSERATA
jgi:excisionase family DNA binding protein